MINTSNIINLNILKELTDFYPNFNNYNKKDLIISYIQFSEFLVKNFNKITKKLHMNISLLNILTLNLIMINYKMVPPKNNNIDKKKIEEDDFLFKSKDMIVKWAREIKDRVSLEKFFSISDAIVMDFYREYFSKSDYKTHYQLLNETNRNFKELAMIFDTTKMDLLGQVLYLSTTLRMGARQKTKLSFYDVQKIMDEKIIRENIEYTVFDSVVEMVFNNFKTFIKKKGNAFKVTFSDFYILHNPFVSYFNRLHNILEKSKLDYVEKDIEVSKKTIKLFREEELTILRNYMNANDEIPKNFTLPMYQTFVIATLDYWFANILTIENWWNTFILPLPDYLSFSDVENANNNSKSSFKFQPRIVQTDFFSWNVIVGKDIYRVFKEETSWSVKDTDKESVDKITNCYNEIFKPITLWMLFIFYYLNGNIFNVEMPYLFNIN